MAEPEQLSTEVHLISPGASLLDASPSPASLFLWLHAVRYILRRWMRAILGPGIWVAFPKIYVVPNAGELVSFPSVIGESHWARLPSVAHKDS